MQDVRGLVTKARDSTMLNVNILEQSLKRIVYNQY